MYDYPIYKNLVQFSNMVDENGKLKPMTHNPATLGGHQVHVEDGKYGDSKGSKEESYDDEDVDDFKNEGGEKENGQLPQNGQHQNGIDYGQASNEFIN